MKILVIGSGGREHALAWKLKQSPRTDIVYVAPGNAGTALEDGVENVEIAADDIQALCDFAKQNTIDLTVVGPEVPLVLGITDLFNANGLRCFGPNQAAAQLEGSKSFTKDFLHRHNIPTADYQSFTQVDEALAYVEQMGAPIVIKADGLAAGKGVIVAMTLDEAKQAVRSMLGEQAFGEASHKIVIEEFLHGEEVSFIVMGDGHTILPMASSQDHKARDNADRGPNTGGMGAVSPAPRMDDELHARILDEIIRPTLQGLEQDGIVYIGFLYAGLMVSPDGSPKVIEFNCRFGDPETQPILYRLNSDLADLCDAALDGNLHLKTANWDSQVAIGVVMASGGYPLSYAKGHQINGLEYVSADCKVFHAGTQQEGDKIVTNGGRVLCVVAKGTSATEAQQKAYQGVKQISWNKVYYRDDIGYRAIAREQNPIANS
ncbi:MAG: phosphoribosylamine--glycine ligase [Gammaproteobacteria bacterium]|nr:phosphoribosylamine--glycine ligase [Gammaproteobacteria bacterium]NNC97492.1 phosphoribosylamine--glycine ligase [Gammaproteobacteria bacterium]NNM13592.1 phosphoribosylamine--glycine ligase [Gammaproteobacteria bacterium]